MKIINLEPDQLSAYVRAQIGHFFPTGEDPALALIDLHLEEALRRLERCVSQVRMWIPGQFDVLHSSQYCIFLYYLSNTIWRRERARTVCTKLFLLNKALNSIDCFYEIELPKVFFIGHSVGIVLAKATYGNYLVLYQNSTVGKNHGSAPVIGERVVMYPGTAIIGRSMVMANTVISQGAGLVNCDSPGNCMVFRGADGRATFKPLSRDIIGDIFRFD